MVKFFVVFCLIWVVFFCIKRSYRQAKYNVDRLLKEEEEERGAS